MQRRSDTAELKDQAIKRLRRLEIIERLLDFDLACQSQYADKIAVERQRPTVRIDEQRDRS